MESKKIYEVPDYRLMAECGQAFEPLMPAIIEAIGEIGAEGRDIMTDEDGHGVAPMGTIDIEGLIGETGATGSTGATGY